MESVSVSISLSDFRIANDIVCVFGQREFSLFRWSKLVDSAFCDASPFYTNDHFVDWIWNVCILNVDDQPLRVAVGTAHNTVVLYDIASNSCVESYYGKERCILYSMSILNLHGELLVASGTVFTEVHVWSPSHPGITSICKGHKGVIFKLRWSEDGRYLLSVSDDRTLIAWKHPCSDSPWSVHESTSAALLLTGAYTPLFHAMGHTARIWDCLFTPSCLLTSSEDCSLRFWSPAGECVATCGGHKGKHVWCVAYDPASGVAASGGNDSSVKLWDVAGIVQAFSSASVTSHLLPTVFADAVDASRDSKAESIREVRVVAADTVLVASNWGYVWRFAPAEGRWETCFAPETHDCVLAAGFCADASAAALGSVTGTLTIVSLTAAFAPFEVALEGCRLSRVAVEREGENYWVVAVQADGHITVLLFSPAQRCVLQQTAVFAPLKGVVTSVLWLAGRHALCYGDSLGGVHLVRVRKDETPFHQCMKRHSRIPVCALAVQKDVLWTGGHDGRLVPIRVDWDTFEWESQTALAVPKIKQILSIWWSEQEDLCVAGFHETDFVVFDLTNMYEVTSVAAGGWKRPCHGLANASHPFRGYTFAFASLNGFTSLCVFRRAMTSRTAIVPALCPASHGREINAVHWIAVWPEGGLLATGGEDRRLQVVRMERLPCLQSSPNQQPPTNPSGQAQKYELRCSVLHGFERHSSSVRALYSCKYGSSRLLI